MEFLRGAIGLLLCWSLSFPTPLALAQEGVSGGQTSAPTHEHSAPQKRRPEYESDQLQGDARILHALNRFTFGPQPGDVDAVRAMGPGKTGLDRWFDAQLHPESLDETDLNARLAEYPAMQWSVRDLMFRMPSPAIIRQAADGKIEIPQGGVLRAVYENQIYRYHVKKAAQAEKQTAATATPTAGTIPNPAEPNPAAAQPAAAGQPDMSAATAPAMNAMAAPAASQSPAAPAADEALIARILALQPEDRLRQLQAMEPADFEGFAKSLRPIQRAGLVAGMSPAQRETVEDLAAPEQTVVKELFAERLARDIYSNAQLQEVMTDFWLNHFNIYLRKNEQMPYYLVSYERDVIRPQALGNFEDLLEAVAHSPAMLVYLDNAQSVGPDSPFA